MSAATYQSDSNDAAEREVPQCAQGAKRARRSNLSPENEKKEGIGTRDTTTMSNRRNRGGRSSGHLPPQVCYSLSLDGNQRTARV